MGNSYTYLAIISKYSNDQKNVNLKTKMELENYRLSIYTFYNCDQGSELFFIISVSLSDFNFEDFFSNINNVPDTSLIVITGILVS